MHHGYFHSIFFFRKNITIIGKSKLRHILEFICPFLEYLLSPEHPDFDAKKRVVCVAWSKLLKDLQLELSEVMTFTQRSDWTKYEKITQSAIHVQNNDMYMWWWASTPAWANVRREGAFYSHTHFLSPRLWWKQFQANGLISFRCFLPCWGQLAWNGAVNI